MSGLHYWEISVIDTQNIDFKIGVTTNNIFNYSLSFSDMPKGYAFYNNG